MRFVLKVKDRWEFSVRFGAETFAEFAAILAHRTAPDYGGWKAHDEILMQRAPGDDPVVLGTLASDRSVMWTKALLHAPGVPDIVKDAARAALGRKGE